MASEKPNVPPDTADVSAEPSGDPLPNWRDTPSRRAIVDFVEAVTAPDGPDFIPPEERVAVFDNDGTLWCEKPLPIQFDFILRRLAAMAEENPELRERQPWQAAYQKDYTWLVAVVVKHYEGDDSDVGVLVTGILQAFTGIRVEEFEAQADTFLRNSQHPTLGRPYMACVYQPMVELLAYLRANGFHNYIATGGGRDFMRPVSQELYSIPRERVIGSTTSLVYREDDTGAGIFRLPELDVLDDGPEKPVGIWNSAGRRPVLAAGNANGDIQMLRFAQGGNRPSLQLLVLHDDPVREFDYVDGAGKALELARADGWTVVSVSHDWGKVF